MKLYNPYNYLLIFTLSLAHTSGFAQRQMPGAGTAPIPVGSEVTDVSAYLADGEAFSLKEQSQGKHTVLVFGCLT